MTDFGLSIYKLKPGMKCYLFLSDYENVLHELLSLSLNSDYTHYLYHPFSANDLGVTMGVIDEKQSIVIRDIEKLNDGEWDLLESFLSQPRIKNLSIFMVGHSASGKSFDKVRSRVSKQGILFEVSDPTTALSQKHLAEWFGDECVVTVSDAHAVCSRLGWRLGDILWVVKAYRSMSGGKSLSGSVSRKLLEIACPSTEIGDSFELFMNKKSYEAYLSVSKFSVDQTRSLFGLLESAISDLSVMYPLLTKGETYKSVADKTGLHIVRVLSLSEYSSRYSDSVVKKCRQALNFGFEYISHPEVAKTVALLWS